MRSRRCAVRSERQPLAGQVVADGLRASDAQQALRGRRQPLAGPLPIDLVGRCRHPALRGPLAAGAPAAAGWLVVADGLRAD
ncbi:MAG: hypothetical protein H6807_05990 [Planctomycetes bacterium]|nr:hypothetical protein [Planctomycetota bacterium]